MKPFHTHSLILSALSLVVLAGCKRPEPWSGVTAEQFARVNEHRIRGTALLENDQKGEAAAEFVEIQKLRPNLAYGYVNEAASYALQPEKSAAVLPKARKGVELLPSDPWPYMVEAALLRNSGEMDKATESLEKALQKGPKQPRVLGAMIRQLKDLPGDHASRLYELRKQLADLTPNNVAAQVEWLQSRLEKGDGAQALSTLERIEEQLPRPSADVKDYLAQVRQKLQAGEDAGAAGRSLVNLLRGNPVFQAEQNELFGAPQDPAVLLMRDWGTAPPSLPEPPLKPATITWKDVTSEAGLAGVRAPGVSPIGIGDLDLHPQAGERVGGTLRAMQDSADLAIGGKPESAKHGGPNGFTGGGPTAAGSPLMADLNNDYTLEVYYASPSGDTLWRNPLVGQTGKEDLTFTRRPAAPPTPMPGRGAGSATAVDLDLDGDLDIARASSDPSQPAVRYLRNNGNFTFSDLTEQSGLKLPSGGARQVVYGDFDGDNDPDLFVVREGEGSRLFLNMRQDVFRDGTAEWKLKPDAGALAAAVADFDRDGDFDLAVAGKAPHGTLIYRNAGDHFEADAEALPIPAGFEPQWVEWLDYDNDTWLDLVVAGQGGVLVLRNEQGKLTPAEPASTEPARWVTWLDYDHDGDLDLLIVTQDDQLKLLSNEGGSVRPSLRFELQGYLVDPKNVGPDQQTQGNNSYAIGSVAEPRTVWDQQKLIVTRPVMQIGLGPAEKAIALRVLWTHGVPQDAVAPAAGEPLHFAQKPTGSCPYLYAWNGEEWVFLKDFNWRSPLGMLQARGKSVPHDLTQDWVKIPGDLLRPEGGYYRLIATEELREIAYFDQLRLLAVDHPQGTGVYLDERFPFGPPDPFRIYTTRQERRPVSARNEAGQDLLPLLEQVDNRYTPVPPGPLRGICAPHDLVLDLGSVPDPQQVKLFLTGWIYPQPNSSNINASQNPEIRMIPPTLSFGDGKGGWTRSDGSVGLPCGKRKTIVLDLSGRFTPGDYRVKLTTTCEIRWDAAFFTSGEAPVGVRQHEIPLIESELRDHGVGETYREVEDGPDLRRYSRASDPGWVPIEGAYTRLGECSPLLRKVDDQYVILAPGDEMRLLFDGRRLPPLPAGWVRDYVVRTDGWTKDTDGNTLEGETVGPLPFHGMKRYPYGPDERFPETPEHRRWMREWNTRVMRRN